MTDREKKKGLKKLFPDKDYWLSYITREELFWNELSIIILYDFFTELFEFLFPR